MIDDLSKPITSLVEGDETPVSLAPEAGLSYVRGPTSTPLWQKTIPQMLQDTIRDHGSRCAAIFPNAGITWSYRDLGSAVDDLAAGLLALGLKKGDRIGIWSPNRPEWLALQFASARVGIILVTINPAYRLSEVEFVLNKVKAKALLLASSFKSSDYIAMINTLAPELSEAEPGRLQAAKLPHLRAVIHTGKTAHNGMFRYDDVMSLAGPAWKNRLDALSADLQPDDPINIQFTSGTTGAPKGATLTHTNILNNGRLVTDRMGLAVGEALCIPVPLYHCFGMVMGVLGSAAIGATMVFPNEAFDPQTTLDAIARNRCVAVYGVPTMFLAMLDHPQFSAFDLSSLRTGIMAGAPCPIEVMRRVLDRMNMHQVTIAYGMTETSPVSCQSHIDDAIDKRVTTVGRVHPHVEIKIIDENENTVAVGQQGELCTRGYSVMRGYWEDDEQTAAVIDQGGWMHTGDLAIMDGDGYCMITGRAKDMIIRGGENIYPKEIEDFLFTHPAIQMVQIFGIPDKKLGEEVCAWVVPKPEASLSEEDIIEFCRGNIAHFKVPRYVQIKAEIPMTVTGKPQKFVMRDAMMKTLETS